MTCKREIRRRRLRLATCGVAMDAITVEHLPTLPWREKRADTEKGSDGKINVRYRT
jgi:hypothetical protein